jgi:hypothetical protein
MLLIASGLLLGACAVPVSQTAICEASSSARTAHAAALAQVDSAAALATGRNLIAIIDAGCGD